MKKNEKPLIIFIAGATGSGKSELAVWLAKQISQIYENKNSNIMNKKICGAEIINADSRQVYKKLNVGSGKINKLGQKGIKHHLLDIASPKKNFSLGRWLKLSNKSIKEILRKNKIPIFCGGTNLYLRALNEGWVLPEVKQDYNLRRQLEKISAEKLFEKLKKIDYRRAKTIESKNKRRLIRAIEIVKSIGNVPKLKKQSRYKILIIVIDAQIKKLEAKIKKRFLKKFSKMLAEIKNLKKSGLSFDRIISFGLSYSWIGKYAKGEILLSEAKEKSIQSEIKFAKRQIRELKKLRDVKFIKNKKHALKICKKFLETLSD